MQTQQLPLGPPGKTYALICTKCHASKWPYLTEPPNAATYTCMWCTPRKEKKPEVKTNAPATVRTVRELVASKSIRPRKLPKSNS